MRVLLVDDHRLLLEGLTNLLEAHGVEIAGTGHDGCEAVAAARALRPDVILMDISMPTCDGLTATRLIRAEWPEARIVILTTSTQDKDLFEAVKSGACGYLLKSMDADELVEALGQAQEGIPPFSPGLAAKLLSEFRRLAESGEGETKRREDAETGGEGDTGSEPALTAREREVLSLVAQGLAYKEVGARLYLSPRTVKYHMAEIMTRLHLEHRAQVLAYAGRLGLGGQDGPSD
jgi:DNA-binding NarL/FixJ family response regulator